MFRTKRMARMLAGVALVSFLAGASGVRAQNETYTTSVEFRTNNKSMWNGTANALVEDIRHVEATWNVGSSGGGFYNPCTPALKVFGKTIIPRICLGDFGASYNVGTNGLIGIGYRAFATAGDVDTVYNGTSTFTLPQHDTVQPGAPYTISSAFQVNNSKSALRTQSPTAGFQVLFRLRLRLTFHVSAKAFGHTIFDWFPLNNWGFDTADLASPSLFEGSSQEVATGFIDVDPGPGTNKYLIILDSDWLLTILQFYFINRKFDLPPPPAGSGAGVPGGGWLIGAFNIPRIAINSPPGVHPYSKTFKNRLFTDNLAPGSVAAGGFYASGLDHVLDMVFSVTNMIFQLATGFPGFNRDYQAGGFSAGFHVLDVRGTFTEALVQRFTYTPEIECTIQYNSISGPATTPPFTLGQNVTLFLADVDNLQLQPTFRIKNKVDFQNDTNVDYIFSVGFIAFEIYGGGSVAGHSLFSFDIAIGKIEKFWTINSDVWDSTFHLPYTGGAGDIASVNTAPFTVWPAQDPEYSIDPDNSGNFPGTKSPYSSYVPYATAYREGVADFQGFALLPDVIPDLRGPVPLPVGPEPTDNFSASANLTRVQSIAPGTRYQLVGPATQLDVPFIVTVTDEAGNFQVHNVLFRVVDKDPPFFLDVPLPRIVQHTDALATPVTFPVPGVRDNTDPNPKVEVIIDGVATDVTGQANYTAAFPIGTKLVIWRTTDASGNSFDRLSSVSVLNDPPVLNSTGPYTVLEGGSVDVTVFGVDLEGDLQAFLWDLDRNGTFESSGVPGTVSGNPASTATVGPTIAVDGPATLTLSAQATETIFRGLTVTTNLDVTVLNVAPTAGAIAAPSVPVEANTLLVASVPFTDPGVLDTHTVTWDWGDGAVTAGTVDETAGSGTGFGTHAYASGGLYTITATVTDKDGGVDVSVFSFVKIFNSDTGFVRGSGRFNLLAGTLPGQSGAEGLALVNFRVRFRAGRDIFPRGRLILRLRSASLNFRSTAIDFLGLSPSKAFFSGTGQNNRLGNYGFFCTANDDPVNRNDTFRVKIWDLDNGNALFFDTQPGAPDDADATTLFTRLNRVRIIIR